MKPLEEEEEAEGCCDGGGEDDGNMNNTGHSWERREQKTGVRAGSQCDSFVQILARVDILTVR